MTETQKNISNQTEELSSDEVKNQEISPVDESVDMKEIVQDLEKRPKKELVKEIIRLERNEYSGPIPPPELLGGYEKILPGAADRILAMAEKQADHRRAMEKTVVESGSRDSKLGLICGTIVCISVMVVGLLLSLITEAAVVGAFMSLSSLASLVGVFIYGTNSNANERKEKRKSVSKKNDKENSKSENDNNKEPSDNKK